MSTTDEGGFGVSWNPDRPWILPLLALFIAKGLLLVFIVGPFTGHDEVDHFYYIERLASGDGLGVVGEVELPTKADRYAEYVADYPTNAEVIQPPLYHLLLVPLSWLVPGSDVTTLYALRLVSIAVGAAVVWLAYAIARLVFPRDSWLRAGTPIFVAFQPQFSFEAAIVNHDIQVIFLSSLLVYLLLKWLPDGYSVKRQTWIALVCGAGLWTKASFGLVLPLVALCFFFAWRDQRAPVSRLVQDVGRACGLALVIALPWFARSVWHYRDPTGAQRLKSLGDYGEFASGYREMITSSVFWRGRLEDFWGNYGWRLVPVDIGVYHAIFLTWAVAGVGLAFFVGRLAYRRWKDQPVDLTVFQLRALAVMILWVGLMVFGVLYIGTIQFTQSRFAFPAMIGFGLLTVFGLGQWTQRRVYLLPLFVVFLTMLNVIIMVRFLIPFYYGADGATALTP